MSFNSVQGMPSNPGPNFDELQWVINIRKTLEEELENDNENPVCIFNVPKTLMAIDPGSYVPHQVAIGPYHRWHPELYEMEGHKIGAARRIQKELQDLTFEDLVDQLTSQEARIRASYHKLLSSTDETLAWMMAIDASFLLEFLQIYAMKEGKELSRVLSRKSHLVDYAGLKNTHNAILRDIMMLENQIPLFVSRKVLEFQLSSEEQADEMLLLMLTGLCKELSPFQMTKVLPRIRVLETAHLLDCLYHVIVPKVEGHSEDIEIAEVEGEDEAKKEKEITEVEGEIEAIKDEKIASLETGPVRRGLNLMRALQSQLFNVIPILKGPAELIIFAENKEKIKPEDDGSSSENNKPPRVEEITIPSASELYQSGVRFIPTTGNILNITFDVKKVTFQLPPITLNVNSEVVLRNLVAYEASNASGPLVFTRYTELMNGIIDTEEDAKLLRENGIILNHLKNDEEVARLWNGMSKSIRLTKVPHLDKAIKDVNRYYNSRWSVKVRNMLKRYVFESWQLLTLLSGILLLLLTTLQTFCSAYNCSRIFHVDVHEKQSMIYDNVFKNSVYLAG